MPPIVKSGADELLVAGGAEVGYERVASRGDKLVPGASGCSSWEAVVKEKQADMEAGEA